MDPEIKAMSDIAEALDGLDDDVAARVLRWAIERYKVSPAGRPARETSTELSQDQVFSEFHELFDAANPSSTPDKALVGCYWLQVVCGEDTIESAALNRLLKDLGHQSKNITRDLDSLIARSPRLVIQVRKEGTTKQARKKYKLTKEGEKTVQAMLTANTA
jgi:hypothetical protein